jgi:hypothetical protein
VDGVSVDGAIARFRRRQLDLFRDTATVTRPGSSGGTISTSDGIYTPPTGTVVYSGACLLRGFQWEGTDARYGDVEVRLRRVRGKFPVDTDIDMDDVVVPTASIYDPSMVGVAFRVTDAPTDGWQIARWVILEEITTP